MSQENNHIDQYFKDRLYGFETPAPTDMWQKIDDKMYARRRKIWWSVIGAMAASFALIISAGIGYYVGINKSEKQIAKNEPVVTSLSNSKVTQEPINKNKESQAINSYNNFKPAIRNNFNSRNQDATATESQFNVILVGNEQKSQDSTQHIIVFNNAIDTINIKHEEEIALMGSETIDTSVINIDEYSIIPLISKPVMVKEEEPILAEKSQKVAPVRWIVGGSIAPVYSYRTIMQNNTGLSSEYFNNYEKALYTYTGGLNIQMEKGRVRIEAGIFYSQMGQKIENLTFSGNTFAYSKAGVSNYIPNDEAYSIRNSNGNIELNSTGNLLVNYSGNNTDRNISDFENTPIKSNNNSSAMPNENDNGEQMFQYIEIPLIGHYQFFSKYIKMGISGGFSLNFLIGNQVYATIDGKQQVAGKTSDIKNLNYAGIAGLSFELPISYRVAFRLEPKMRYYLNSIANSDKINTHPYTFGIYSGICYKF